MTFYNVFMYWDITKLSKSKKLSSVKIPVDDRAYGSTLGSDLYTYTMLPSYIDYFLLSSDSMSHDSSNRICVIPYQV